jgi:hypothetical protein
VPERGVVDPVLRGLARGLTRLAADRSAERGALRVALVFLGYERARVLEAAPAVWRAAAATGHDVTAVLVENRPLDLPDLGLPGVVTVAGDNSMHEFSGWERGREATVERTGRPDVWLFANDRMLDYGYPFVELLTAGAVTVAAGLEAVSGKVDHYPREVTTFGLPVRRWTRTACFLVRDGLLARLGTLATVDAGRLDELFPPGRPAFGFEAEGIDATHSAFLRTFLFHEDGPDEVGRWHAGPLDRSAGSWELARHKVGSILNEQLLSARVRELGGLCVPLETCHWLGELGAGSRRAGRLQDRIRAGGEPAAMALRHPSGRLRALVGRG